MNKLLRLKHWQVFLLLVGLPIAALFVSLALVYSSANFVILAYIIPFATVLFMGLQAGWLYALGAGLHKKLPPTVKMNLSRFRLSFIPPALYLIFTLASGLLLVWDAREAVTLVVYSGHWKLLQNVMNIIQLFSFFCMFYALYFIARTFRSAEQRELVDFSDYISELLLLLFLPIGVWILQPRINELASVQVEPINPDPEILDGGL